MPGESAAECEAIAENSGNQLTDFGELFAPPRRQADMVGGSEIEEERLRGDTRLAGFRRQPTVAPGSKQLARGKRVGKICVENLVADPMSQRSILQRNDNLDAAIEIPR